MNIPKAIETGHAYLEQGYIMSTQDLHDFIALGIEALKAFKGLRQGHGAGLANLLPGETEE